MKCVGWIEYTNGLVAHHIVKVGAETLNLTNEADSSSAGATANNCRRKCHCAEGKERHCSDGELHFARIVRKMRG